MSIPRHKPAVKATGPVLGEVVPGEKKEAFIWKPNTLPTCSPVTFGPFLQFTDITSNRAPLRLVKINNGINERLWYLIKPEVLPVEEGMRQFILQSFIYQPPPPTINDLPDAVMQHIFDYLPIPDLLTVAQVSQAFHAHQVLACTRRINLTQMLLLEESTIYYTFSSP